VTRRWARRPTGITALVTLLAAALTGCGSLPTPNGVRDVRAVAQDEPRDDVDLRRIPAGPQRGQSPQEVVQAFLAAGADAEVARQFLTPGNPWDPARRVVVFRGTPVVPDVPSTSPSPVAVAVELAPLLTVREDGSTVPGGPDSMGLQLVRLPAGEWRISQVPDGLPLREADLATTLRRVVLTWLAADRRSIVREPVLLAAGRNDLLDATVAALGKGPSDRLRAAGVTSALPPGAGFLRVVARGGGVTVDLDPGAVTGSRADVAVLRAQLAATLLSLPGVTSVRVQVQGQPLLSAGATVDAPLTAADVAAFDRDVPGPALTAYVAEGAGVHRLRGGPAAAATDLTALAVAPDGQRVALLRRVPGGVRPEIAEDPALADAKPLAPPGPWTSVSWGRDASLWLVRDGRVSVRLRAGGPVDVPSPPGTPRLRYLRVAPDGVHAVGVAVDGSLVTALVDPGGSAPVLTDVHPVVPALSGVTAVAYVDGGTGGARALVAGTVAMPAGPDAGDRDLPTARSVRRTGLFRVLLDAPDPLAGDDLSGRVDPVAAACRGPVAADSLSARPGVPALAGCPDGQVYRLDGEWVPAGGGRFPAWPAG